MDRLSIVVKTVIVVVAAVGLSVPLAAISWLVSSKLGIPVSIGLWVLVLLPSKDGGMFEGLNRMGIAFCIDIFLYFGAICFIALVSEIRHQNRTAADHR
jgi:hypothetical protein